MLHKVQGVILKIGLKRACEAFSNLFLTKLRTLTKNLFIKLICSLENTDYDFAINILKIKMPDLI